MACLDMYNKSNDHKKTIGGAAAAAAASPPPHPPPPMSPRISFSNDFVESSSTSHSHPHMMRAAAAAAAAAAYRDAPVSSDFEFSISSYSSMATMSADELFFKGKLLPFKQSCSKQVHKTTTTLRDELQVQDDDDDDDDDSGNNGGDDFSSLKPPKSSTRWKGLLGLKKSHIASKKLDKTHERSLEKRPNNLPFDDSQEQNPREFEFRI